MSLDNPNGIVSSVSKDSKQRRVFLKRATAGAVIASIPARSAWAGIAGSIVASGHGSDAQAGVCTVLSSKFNASDYKKVSFESVFGGIPWNDNGALRTNGDLTFKEILTTTNRHKKGVNSVNIGLVLMYLNAVNHGYNGIFYPAIEQHGSEAAFANYLYTSASEDPAGVGKLLNDTIIMYSSGGAC
ncbi:hypothetical protein [Paraglaciecola sp. 2405UD69-4]|uniref:hypothetical protein n=1 Tax=Paraglaciecola sp. 2405UD69-4 TaxID=3391836 RepID=UPI0039C9D06F